MQIKKPTFLGPDHAVKFKHQSVAAAYKHRPPYADEVFDTLGELVQDTPRNVLDAGCGPGKIALGLVDKVDRVDAVDFSQAMIDEGKARPGGENLKINWICAAIEDAELCPPYALIVAGASLHWMDWTKVFPIFQESLTKNGVLAIVEGDLPFNAPWKSAEKTLIKKYSTNQEYRPYDMIEELIQHKLFEKIGEKTTHPGTFTQTLDAYVESFHSRESLCKEAMGPETVQAFDAELIEIVKPFSKGDVVTFEVCTRITWGCPQRLHS
jgi:trans-aconitate methyltransferase